MDWVEKIAFLLITVVITGCATVPTETECTPVEVMVPVTISCVTEIPTRPEMMTANISDSATDFAKIQALTVDFISQKQYINQLEAVIAGCK